MSSHAVYLSPSPIKTFSFCFYFFFIVFVPGNFASSLFLALSFFLVFSSSLIITRPEIRSFSSAGRVYHVVMDDPCRTQSELSEHPLSLSHSLFSFFRSFTHCTSLSPRKRARAFSFSFSIFLIRKKEGCSYRNTQPASTTSKTKKNEKLLGESGTFSSSLFVLVRP